MHPVLDYILKANVLLLFFGFFYLIFLKRETFYQLNRWYFIGSIIVSITAPLITFTKTVLVDPIPVEYFVTDSETVVRDEVVKEPSFLETVDLQQISVYLILFISFVLIIKKIYAVVKLYRSIEKMPSLDASNIKIATAHNTVYSFYQWIVVPENFFQWQNHQLILDHESVHLNQKHTFDLILIELVSAVFWFNPLVKVMQHAINTNLEFIVDQKMIETTDSVLYQKNLLQYKTQRPIQFANSYNGSELKNRILQINSKKSTRMKKLKFLLATPALLAFFALFQVETIAQVKETIKVQEISENKKEQNLTAKTDENITNNESLKTKDNVKQDNDFLSLMDAVSDLKKFKTDRATFNKIATKIPITVDGVLQSKNDLKEFNLETVQSLHLDMSNLKKGTVLNLSTQQTNQENLRSFSFNTVSFEDIRINGKEATKEELENHIDAINSEKEKNSTIIKIDRNGTNIKFPKNSKHLEDGTVISEDGKILAKIETKENFLYMVNGKEVNNDDFRKINPNDIERIDVLKDEKSKEKYGATKKDGVLLITTKAKKEVSLQQKNQALQARELAMKQRKDVIAQRKEMIKQRKSEIEKMKQVKNDLKTVTSIFNNVQKIKNTEDENFKITSISASITREDGTKVELAENY